MGQSSRAQVAPGARSLAALAAVLAWTSWAPAFADPIVDLPPEGKGVLREQEDGPGLFSLIGDVSGIGVLGAEDMTTLPRYGSLVGAEPELGLARVGLLGVHDRLPVSGLVRFDFSEAFRVESGDFSDHTLASLNRFIDDASVWWRAVPWANIIVGRQRVPFSRFRQLDVTRVQAGAAPFLVDRVVPARRWGATLHGDLGAMSYLLGGFEDAAHLQQRADMDPSEGGRGMVAFHFEWTPRAPLGDDHLATPRDDPWFDTVKVSAGVGALYRVRRGGNHRVDVSVSGQMKWRQLSGITELLLSSDAGDVDVGTAGQVGALVTDKITIYSRAELDREASLWSVGWGAAYFATPDRRSKVGIYGWMRRETGDSAIRRDGVIVQLQASL